MLLVYSIHVTDIRDPGNATDYMAHQVISLFCVLFLPVSCASAGPPVQPFAPGGEGRRRRQSLFLGTERKDDYCFCAVVVAWLVSGHCMAR